MKNIQQLINYLEAIKMESGRDTELKINGCEITDFEDCIDVDHVKDVINIGTEYKGGNA